MAQRKTIGQKIKWWWSTRVIGLFRVRLKPCPGKLHESSYINFAQTSPEFDNAQSEGITVILNAYRRVEYLAEQVKSIREQTIAPSEIWLWYNASPDKIQDVSRLVDRVVVSNTNWLFWGRFALGNLVRTKYVAFFDDDILPQPRWLENCLNTIKENHNRILGGSGVILPLEGGYSSKNKIGWNDQHLAEATLVDLVGHAWFMPKEHLKYMWYEQPFTWDNGEDIHLGYTALKYGDVKTYVPSHPENDQSLWSCRPDFGKIVGRKNVATFKTSDHKDIRSEMVDYYRDNGWQIVAELDGKKQFAGDLRFFNLKLKNKENFSLVRFGDGEMDVINGKKIDLYHKCNGEHRYIPGNEEDEEKRKILTESLLYTDKKYFVGLPCRCCVGDDKCDRLRGQSKQDVKQLTWANIFVNANYKLFKKYTVPLFDTRIVNIVCHNKAQVKNLPFAIKQAFRVGANAWSNDFEKCLVQIKEYIEHDEIKNEVFIFCAGVLSNMLIYELSKTYPSNTYLDLGSVFDDIMGLGKTRKYLSGRRKQLNKVCVW